MRVLHALWAGPAGVVWWVERSPGRRADGSALHPGALSVREVRRLAQGGSTAVREALAGAADTVQVLLPCAGTEPLPTPDLLRRLPRPRAGDAATGACSLAVVGVPVVRPGLPASVAALCALAALEEGADLGADLVAGAATRFLARFVRDVVALADAGRISPVLAGAWPDVRPVWFPTQDDDVRAWFDASAEALPPVLRAVVPGGGRARHGRPASEVLVEVVVDVLAAVVEERLRTAAEHGLPWREAVRRAGHPLLTSLAHGTPLQVPQRRLEPLRAQLGEWASSQRRRQLEVVLRLVEPDDDGGGDVPEPEGWLLDVGLRIDGEAPLSRSDLDGDAEALDALTDGLARAVRAHPPLRSLERVAGADLRLALGAEAVLDLVDRGAGRLARAGLVLLLPRSWARMEPSLRMHAESPARVDVLDRQFGMDRLVTWNWRVALGPHELSEQELDLLAESKSGLVRLRGEWVRLDPRTLAAVHRFVRNSRGGAATFSGLLGQLAGAEPPPAPVEDVRATGWLGELLAGEAEHRIEEVPAPSALAATLRPYQRRGLSWLAFMDRLGLGAVLADDMGLGKTVQVLALLLHERELHGAQRPGPTLLVCPMSLVGNWAREAARFAPSLRVVVHHGGGRARGEQVTALAEADLVVTTYGLLDKDLAALREVPWRRLVLDEAHHVKNSSTRQARAVRQVPAARRVALTGTPVENRLEELRGVLDAVAPGVLGSAAAFRQRFARPIERDGDAAVAARLRTVTRPFVLRRVKTDRSVIADLPEKVEMVVPVNLTREQAALYRATVAELLKKVDELTPMQRRGLVLRTLTRLKQICNHPAHFLSDGSPLLTRGRHRSGKLAAVEDVVESLLAEGDKALLFTQFAEFGHLLVPYLSDRFGVEVPFLHGGVARTRRDAMVARFQAEDGPPLMLLSLKAGGSGLNLTAASHVVHLDRWWNPAVENQATDRAFRIGQQRRVQVRKLVSIGTVEERIDATLTEKSELADLVLARETGAGEGWVTELDTAALRELLTLSPEAVGE
ncbi:SNF2 family DNA or RNA helicase [Kineococcus xinjiangensis]|uniref:SNF2 family DNA or RNA helicase n=1 Tax=Kineococcus xinjiangensis TaxID=512762 RepID=A0A2S6IHN9_9ACTN|nr:DEAD/DEAH box helicase [Kineococcus xinjiangensis]PPK93733.1 SNF2 family DNA or RNA helicase [Kineococcus xinjiangensis]